MTRLVVVEDERLVALDLRSTLEGLGYEVVDACGDGETAVEVALSNDLDLILMDINLGPGIDGIEAATAIRAKKDIPIIFLTAYTDDQTLSRSGDALPFGYVVKPFDERELHAAIQVALQKHRADQALERERRRMTTVLGALEDGVVALGAQRQVLFSNPAMARLLGSDEPVTWQSIVDACSDKNLDTAVAAALKKRRRVGLPSDMSIGDTIVDGSITPMDDGVLVVLHDVAAQKQAERLHRQVISLQARLASRAHELV